MNIATLATRYAGRPVLMTSTAALEVAHRLRDVDARAFERPSRIGAILRKLSRTNAVRPSAMEDDGDGPPAIPFAVRAAYAPLYAGEPEDFGYCWSLNSGVALLQCDTPLLERGEEDICGTVHHGYDTLLQALRETSADDRVRARFVRLNCPGGVVASGLEALAAFMRADREAAGGKPIWVYADMACSAAYWIAAQADRIIAGKVGLVGSIGAVLVHENWSGALEKAGLALEVIQFGEGKTDGAWWAALSDRAREDLLAEINQCGRNFVADVVAGRPKLTAEALLATQARVFMAEHDEPARSGLAIGFVDEIAAEAEAFAALVAHVSTPGDSLLSPPAVGGRTATTPEKDKPMADKALTTPGRASALARATALRAEADTLEATAGADTQEGGDGADTVEGDDAPDTLAGGQAGDAVTATADDADEAEAQSIANSPEAKANPGLAVNAIASKMTLAQFRAAASAGPAAGKGALAVVMADASRLGPDAAKTEAVGPATAGATFQRNLEKGLAGRRK